MPHASLVTDVAAVLGVASLISIAFRRLGQPAVLGYLLAGLIVGPYIPIPLFADPKRTHELSEFGVVLVMFAVGLEFSLARVLQILPVAGITATVQISGVAWGGYLLGLILGFNTLTAVFLGASVAISSTMVVTRVFADRPPDPDVRSLVLGVLVLQDIAAIVLIATVTAIAQGVGLDAGQLGRVVAELVGTLIGGLVLGLLLIPRLARYVRKLGSTEVWVVFGVGLCFAFAGFAAYLGYSPALGAFLAGMLIAESGQGRQMEHLVAPLRDVFAAVFFVSVGMTVDPIIALEHIGKSVAVAATVILLQFILVASAALLSGNVLRRATQGGLALGQIGEFGFIMVGIGASAGVIPDFMMAIVVSASVITAFTTPLCLRAAPGIAAGIEQRLPSRLREALSMYAAWVDELKGREYSSPERRRTRRAIEVLVIDALAVLVIVVSGSIGARRGARYISELFEMRPGTAYLLIIAAAALAALPFVAGIARASRTLAVLLGNIVFPVADDNRSDLLHTSRRALAFALQLAILLAVGLPLIALTQPFVPPVAGLAILSVLVFPTLFYVARSTKDLQLHVRSATQGLFEVLRQDLAKSGDRTVDDLLHGLGDVSYFEIPEGAPAAGRTLAQINLRVTTGATVLAIARPGGDIAAPLGNQALEVGDTLALAGPKDAIERVRQVLTEEPPAPSPGPVTDMEPDDAQSPEPKDAHVS